MNEYHHSLSFFMLKNIKKKKKRLGLLALSVIQVQIQAVEIVLIVKGQE